MSIKLEDVRVGDELELKRVVVVYKDGTRGPFKITASDGGDVWLNEADIAAHIPREFKQDDEVRNDAVWRGVRLFVIATYGQMAWGRDEGGCTTPCKLSDLRHADPVPAPQEAGKERKKIVDEWWNHHADGRRYVHFTKEGADFAAENSFPGRIACLHVVGYEGDGL